MLSSVFVPLYGVILGRLGCAWAGASETSHTPTRVNTSAALIWVLGIAVFHACAQWMPQYGSALPSLLVTFVLAWATRQGTSGDDTMFNARGA